MLNACLKYSNFTMDKVNTEYLKLSNTALV